MIRTTTNLTIRHHNRRYYRYSKHHYFLKLEIGTTWKLNTNLFPYVAAGIDINYEGKWSIRICISTRISVSKYFVAILIQDLQYKSFDSDGIRLEVIKSVEDNDLGNDVILV